MKQKLNQKLSLQENPYIFFSEQKNFYKSRNSHFNLSETPDYGNTFDKSIQDNELKENFRKTSKISNVSRSLKTVALNTKLYGNYINFYSTITQKNCFKAPKILRYPILTNENYLSIKLQPLTERDSSQEKITLSPDRSNSIFLANLKVKKPFRKFIEKKPYGFKYGKTKIILDSSKTDDSFTAGKYFGELCDKNLFESKFLEKIGLRKIDMDNCYEEKQNNFNFFCEYIKRKDEFKDIFSLKNFHRNISFNGRTAIKNKILELDLNIYSLCFKFFSLSEKKKEKECQRLYFPFILMPFFYLLDFTSFKVLLSEIIIFNKTNNRFEYIKENSLINIVNKYINYISNSLEHKNGYINNITYNKKETIFPLIYDWIITKHSLYEEDEEENKDNVSKNNFNDYRCFKLKIMLPKIKFNIDNLNMKIHKFLNKNIIAYLLRNKFNKWENYIFFDLFSTKRFKIIINLIMLNKIYGISLKKIKLSKNYKMQNKNYEFFLTQIGENYSLYYTFIPHVVLIVFGEKDKKFQKIILSLKDSINLVKYEKDWGMINTLFKCMFLDKINNRIFFKLELLENDKNELYNNINKKNNRDNNPQKIINLDNNKSPNSGIIKKVPSLSFSIREKKKEQAQARYKDRMFEISLLKCSLRKINITTNNSEDKYYEVPQNILDGIFNIKDENKIFNTSCTDISIIAKYIGENSQSIFMAKESDNISEEKKMIDKADIEIDKYKDDLFKIGSPKKENLDKANPRNKNSFIRLKTFQIVPSKILLKKDSENETKKEEKVEIKNFKRKDEKRLSNKFAFPKGIIFARNEKKRVSITSLKELNLNRVNNITNDILKRQTLTLRKYN